MDDAQLVQVFYSSYDLMKEFASLSLFDPLVLHDEVKELSSTRIFHDQVELLRRLNNLWKEILFEKGRYPTS